jgi:hypothetical protein
MAILSRLIVAMALPGLLVSNAWCDVIPNRYAEDSGERDAVESRLTDLGLSSDEAGNHASLLTDDEVAYFAQDASRLRMVGKEVGEVFAGQVTILWWEFLFGCVALAGTGYGIYRLADRTD